MSGVRVRSSGLFGGDSEIEFDDPPMFQTTTTPITAEQLSAAIHEVYCRKNARMHSAPDHSAALILDYLTRRADQPEPGSCSCPTNSLGALGALDAARGDGLREAGGLPIHPDDGYAYEGCNGPACRLAREPGHVGLNRERLMRALVDVPRTLAVHHWPWLTGNGWLAYSEEGREPQILIITELADAITAEAER